LQVASNQPLTLTRRHVEKEDLNQYWYSSATIKVLVQV